MLKRALTYVVLILVVLQSGMAMGDAHRLHQSGTEHVVFGENDRDLDGDGAEKHLAEEGVSDELSASKWDCDHCCHGRGHFCSVVLRFACGRLVSRSNSLSPA